MPDGTSCFFGAGYGNRTRLHGLGSRCITDIRTLRCEVGCIIADPNGKIKGNLSPTGTRRPTPTRNVSNPHRRGRVPRPKTRFAIHVGTSSRLPAQSLPPGGRCPKGVAERSEFLIKTLPVAMSPLKNRMRNSGRKPISRIRWCLLRTVSLEEVFRFSKPIGYLPHSSSGLRPPSPRGKGLICHLGRITNRSRQSGFGTGNPSPTVGI